MGMSIDKIIANEIKLAQEFQKAIDTHMTSDNFSLEEMYCDDTEVIEEQLQRCKVFADYHNQIANIIRKYQKIEQLVISYGLKAVYRGELSRFEKEILEVIENGNDD